jgi:hypothetical protein
MSALAVAGRGWEDAGRRGVGAGGTDEEARPAQPRLFALPGGAVEEAPAATAVPASAAPRAVASPAAPPAPAVVAPAPVRTLDELVGGTWSALVAGHAATCPLCSGTVVPGAGAVGGRCIGCGTLLD